jgi:hypothetical protein
MQTREARLLYSSGVIKAAVLRQTAGGWQAELTGKHTLNPVLELARGGPRVFKSLDAAAEALFEIGVTAFKVERNPKSA